ncbi:hypothetical protein Dthio_PD1430 [Desulfonatronospira thiodismutans ASO3-1]|uniref:Uncharacterized protein n=1 Tax=Desulfonatronospira thiodismutans ASO3-1 TaxID=555779 RepID=D6STS4_9BACT|nr:hypothetical protein [Desulfonatronospira thiodismutans]EFI34090.1 hypothetical protein Dthio_PD1430 [Desulfonatronospira thiodismutans ASO3-1]
MATTTCPECGRVNDVASLVEFNEYVEGQAVAALCSCGELHDLSPEMETEYWMQRLLDAQMEWSREAHHPF